MERLDIKAIIEEEAVKVSMMRRERRTRPFGSMILSYNQTPAQARIRLMGNIWRRCIAALQEDPFVKESVAAEKTIVALMKLGAVKEKVRYMKDSFRLKLANSEYRFYKIGAEVDFYACPWPFETREKICMSSERFAEFVIEFDASIPDIDARIPQLMKDIYQRELEEKKQDMEDQIKRAIVETFIRQIIEPLGLRASFVVTVGVIPSNCV